MKIKTKAENIKLFSEANELRQNVRSELHQKAFNQSQTTKAVQTNKLYNKVSQH
jgi:hypothetical protein